MKWGVTNESIESTLHQFFHLRGVLSEHHSVKQVLDREICGSNISSLLDGGQCDYEIITIHLVRHLTMVRLEEVSIRDCFVHWELLDLQDIGCLGHSVIIMRLVESLHAKVVCTWLQINGTDEMAICLLIQGHLVVFILDVPNTSGSMHQYLSTTGVRFHEETTWLIGEVLILIGLTNRDRVQDRVVRK